MKPHAALTLGLTILLAGMGVALAEDRLAADRPGALTRERITIDESMADVVPSDALQAGGSPPCRLIFLNNCKATGGCTVRSGWESSINNTSSIISGTRNLSAFAHSDAVWAAVVQCVRETYAPFNIDVTDVDPGNVCHWEAIVAGTPQQAGFGSGVAGVSPWTQSCSIIQNSITYTFANLIGPDVRELCWTAAQETAHSFGLEHEMNRNDPMTYLGGSTLPGGYKRFQNELSSCGEYQARTCDCQRNRNQNNRQNSVTDLMRIFGPSTPTPPVITITEPSDGAQVLAGFRVRAMVDDESRLPEISLEINGAIAQTLTQVNPGPVVFTTEGDLGEGTYQLRVLATDSQGTPGASAPISVVIGPPCLGPADCEDQGDGYTCVGGRCVPGDTVDGGLGTSCEDDQDCFSGQCQHSDRGAYCVEVCTPGSSDCPSGFRCLDTGGSGICWPAEGGGIGCFDCTASGPQGGVPTLPILLGLILGGLLVRRRRRA
jgi:MYXO-CTERM domain-containing protein